MLTRIAFMTGVMFTSLATAADFSPEVKAELARLAGPWRIVSTERDGKLEANPPEPVLVRVEDDKLLFGGRDIGLCITMIALESSPRIMDISHPESKKTLEAIYELRDNQWRICLNIEGEGARERPGDFVTVGKTKFVTVVLQREKE